MNRKTIYLSLFCLFLGIDAYAQYAENALRFSQTFIGGSARMRGLGGAQTSLGGDISAASGNPAGLGFYNRSEFSISPSLRFANATSTFLGNTTKSITPILELVIWVLYSTIRKTISCPANGGEVLLP